MTQAADGSVIKDGQVIDDSTKSGQKQTPEPKTEPQVEMVEAEIGGVKVNVPKIFADSHKALESKIDSLVNDLATLKKGAGKEAAKNDTPNPLADIETMLFAEPAKAVALILAEAKRQALGEVNQQTSAQKAQSDFWDAFYKENSDIDRETDGVVVNAVLTAEYPTLKDMKVPDAIKHLAKKSKESLLKIAQKRGGGSGAKPQSEGGNKTPSGGSNDDKSVSADTQVTSLSSVIRDRRAARAAGKAPAKS